MNQSQAMYREVWRGSLKILFEKSLSHLTDGKIPREWNEADVTAVFK